MAKSSKTIQMAAVAIVAIVAVAAIGFVLLGNQDDTPALEKIRNGESSSWVLLLDSHHLR